MKAGVGLVGPDPVKVAEAIPSHDSVPLMVHVTALFLPHLSCTVVWGPSQATALHQLHRR